MRGGATVVGQAAEDPRVRPEVTGSLDLFVDVPVGRGTVHLYVEGGTSRVDGGVSQMVLDANTDAGTALDGEGDGRVQLSEMRLIWPLGGSGEVHAGLLDATGFLDVSRIANDENLFFLGAPFVNNPTIEFPDYALGAAVRTHLRQDGTLELTGVLTSSSGLADNPGRSYGRLVDVAAPGKGAFIGATLRWSRGDRRASLGGWTRTETRARRDGRLGVARNRGLFAVAGERLGAHSVSGRLGVANGAVSPVSLFLGLTYLWSPSEYALGLGTGAAVATPTAGRPTADSLHGELFVRRTVLRRTHVTLSVQAIDNPGLDATGLTVETHLWIIGVRVGTPF